VASRDEALRLREALLEPGQGRFTKAEFVGRDETSAFAFGLVRDRSGAVVAYVSDGRGIGEWFTGSTEDGRLALSGDEGGRLEGAIARGGVEGKAEVADQTIGFTLEAADRGAGLRRLVSSVSDREIECAFVTCNAGAIYGVGKTGDAVAFSYRVESDEIPDGDSVTPGPGVDAEEPEPRRFLGQLRCAILVLKYSRCDNDLLYGRGQCSYEQLEQLGDSFSELGCADLGWNL
jgi:hypothetical protein